MIFVKFSQVFTPHRKLCPTFSEVRGFLMLICSYLFVVITAKVKSPTFVINLEPSRSDVFGFIEIAYFGTVVLLSAML
jgi:hypothetical protein